MNIKIPSEIILDSVTENFLNFSAACSHMMFEAITADILHKFLEFRNLSYRNTTIHSVWVISYESLSKICLDTSLCIIGRNTEICKVPA